MKNTTIKLILALIFPLICLAQHDDSIDVFYDQIAEEVHSCKEKPEEGFQLNLLPIMDNFIIALFNTVVKDSDYMVSLPAIAGGERINVISQRDINSLIVGIKFSYYDHKITYNDNVDFWVYQVGKNEHAYFIGYLISIRGEYGEIIGYYQTFRIIKPSRRFDDYEIIARFEDSNWANYKGDYVFKDLADNSVSPMSLVGGLNELQKGSCFLNNANGSISFSTGGNWKYSPSSLYGTTYIISWIISPDMKLYATEVKWNANEIEDEKGNVHIDATVIKLEH